MFGRKKHSWSWIAVGSLLVSGVIYWFSRLFRRMVEKESNRPYNKKSAKRGHSNAEELFI